MFALRVMLFCVGIISVSSAQVAVEGSSCKIPDGRVGKCLRWDNCPLTKEVMNRIRPRKEDVQYIKTLNCGYRGYQPYHCCIEEMVLGTIKPEVTATTTMEVHKQTERNSLESHPNSHLLPLASCGIKPQSHIRGGTVAQLGDFPWLALLHYTHKSGYGNKLYKEAAVGWQCPEEALDMKSETSAIDFIHDATFTGRTEMYACGGALINNRYVLTAAHCVHKQYLGGFEPDMVRLGEHDLARNPDSARALNGQLIIADPVEDVEIEEVFPYEGYTAANTGQTHDIALIRLKRNVSETKWVRSICLPSPDVEESILERAKLDIAGWGRTEYNSNPSKLKLKAVVPLVDRLTCAKAYKGITESHLCAGKEGTDACRGDSGGPLTGLGKYRNLTHMRHFVVGIVSYGRACGISGVPGVYTRVLPYISWILDHMRP